MEKTTKRQMKVKYIPVQSDEFEEITEYKTFDGKVFRNEHDAQKYEDDINYEKIERGDYTMVEIGDWWYRAKNQEEIEVIKRRYGIRGGKIRESINHVKPGEWFTIHVDYGGDYPDVYNFITLKEYLIDVNALKEKLESQ